MPKRGWSQLLTPCGRRNSACGGMLRGRVQPGVRACEASAIADACRSHPMSRLPAHREELDLYIKEAKVKLRLEVAGNKGKSGRRERRSKGASSGAGAGAGAGSRRKPRA